MSRYGQGRGGRPWRRIVERIKLRDQYTCQKCGKVTQHGEVDHRLSLSRGGTDDDDNLQYLCATPCHRDKSIREAGGTPVTACGADGWPVIPGRSNVK